MRRITLKRELVFLHLLLAAPLLLAQPDRVRRIDPSHSVLLHGHVSREATLQLDRGPVDATHRISGITLLLNRTERQQEELEKLLVDQQDPSSPDYHAWLAPEQFAERFGLSQPDVDRITGWLASEGFSIDHVARARNFITFSGAAGQIRKTFRTEIRNYFVEGKLHYANASNPSIPEALAPHVLGITGLDNLPRFRHSPAAKLNPQFNRGDGAHALAPADIATIYNIAPLHAKGFDGAGQKLVVVGRTDIKSSDVDLFRKTYGLPAGTVQKVLVKGSAEPGIVTEDFAEANIDLDWTIAVAPKATILYVYATDLWDSAKYAIDQNLAPVISMSYTVCEARSADVPAQAAAFFQRQAQQANAQGITWVAATGDAGAAGCEKSSSKIAKTGLGVNLPASVPEITAVGGTEFNEGTGVYWNATNGSTKGSARGYIPEKAWNDADDTQILGTGGGASILFSKPSWQAGPGVPNDRVRDIPDISFSASSDHDPYCITLNGEVACNYGGTSIATPVFAGVLTLLNQYQVASGAQAKPGMGNVNPKLYSLAQTSPGIFHDITVGSNIVPCAVGTPDCTPGGLGYRAGPGYDLATGLGSADVYNLVTGWSMPASGSTTTTVSAKPASIAPDASTTITAIVKSGGGTATPTGTVTFSTGSKSLGSAKLTGSGGTATASINVAGKQLNAGLNSTKASYGGDTGFSASSASTNVTVMADGATVSVEPSVDPNPVYQQAPDADGYSWYYTLKLTETAGVGSTVTGLFVDGDDYSQYINDWFGTATLRARGTLSVGLRSSFDKLPATQIFAFTGVDAKGAKWSQQVAVEFRGKAPNASIVLSSSPATVRAQLEKDTGCPAGYPFYQVLTLQEKYGYPVTLNKFLAGGNDFSAAIADWFGSTKLGPVGTLQTTICWQLDGPFPVTLDYEVAGADSTGAAVSAKLSTQFLSGPDLGDKSGLAQTMKQNNPQTHRRTVHRSSRLVQPGGTPTN